MKIYTINNINFNSYAFDPNVKTLKNRAKDSYGNILNNINWGEFMAKINWMDSLPKLLSGVGALIWGLVYFFNFNPINYLVDIPFAIPIVYTVVAISGGILVVKELIKIGDKM